jgi:hypothetical protein
MAHCFETPAATAKHKDAALTAGDKLKGEISSSSPPLAAALGAALALLASVLLVLALSAAAALLSGFGGDVAAVDSLLDGLLFAPLWPPLPGCADLSSSKPAGQGVGNIMMAHAGLTRSSHAAMPLWLAATCCRNLGARRILHMC